MVFVVYSCVNDCKPEFFFSNVAKDVLCKEPEQIRNGRLNTANEPYSAGSTVFYQCLNGFEIKGEASLTCTYNGNWSNDPPECKREYFYLFIYFLRFI